MLAPRLRNELAGQPESDMADGMVMQGQRLADVVAQLEAALRPQAGSRGLRQQQQLALPAAADAAAAGAVMPGVGMPGVAYDSFDDIEDIDLPDVWHTDDQQQLPPLQQQLLPQQQAKGLPSGVAAKAGYLPEHISSSSTSTVSDNTAVQVSSSQPQELPHLPGQGTAGSLGSSSRDIRWGLVESPAAAATTTTVTSASSASSSSKECSASYSVVPGQLDMQKTIDLEVMGVEGTLMSLDADSSTSTSSSSSSSTTVVTAPAWLASSSRSSSPSDSADSSSRTVSSSRRGGSSSTLSRRNPSASSVTSQQPASCNLIDTIGHLLTAAANLALVEGKTFIVTPPLQLDQAVAPPAGSSSSGAGALLPGPIRPLLVGLAANTCRRVLGYVLDVALQCTPRGGQLCVTARESSGGVELSLLHTGQVQASRVHTTSKALSPAGIYSSSSSSSGAAQQQPDEISSSSSTFAVEAASSAKRSSGSSKRSRRVVQELSSSGSSRASSSSIVSLDFAGQLLQEIGGRLAVVYPIQFMNAVSGNLEVGSSIEVWLPPPVQGATV
jgi:hypothetical protein